MAFAKTIYVTKSGNDTSGNGTYATPYLTVGKALANTVSGDNQIIIGTGTYAEIINYTGANNIYLVGDITGSLTGQAAGTITFTISSSADFITCTRLAQVDDIIFSCTTSAYSSYSFFKNVGVNTPDKTCTFNNCTINNGSYGYMSVVGTFGQDHTVIFNRCTYLGTNSNIQYLVYSSNSTNGLTVKLVDCAPWNNGLYFVIGNYSYLVSPTKPMKVHIINSTVKLNNKIGYSYSVPSTLEVYIDNSTIILPSSSTWLFAAGANGGLSGNSYVKNSNIYYGTNTPLTEYYWISNSRDYGSTSLMSDYHNASQMFNVYFENINGNNEKRLYVGKYKYLADTTETYNDKQVLKFCNKYSSYYDGFSWQVWCDAGVEQTVTIPLKADYTPSTVKMFIFGPNDFMKDTPLATKNLTSPTLTSFTEYQLTFTPVESGFHYIYLEWTQTTDKFFYVGDITIA